MLTLLLGIDVMIGGWIAAHLLAAVSAYLLMRTSAVNSFTYWLSEEQSNDLSRRASRLITFTFMVVALGSLLTVVMGTEPLREGLWSQINSLLNLQAVPTMLFAFMDKLLTVAGILLLLLAIPVINRVFARIYKMIDGWRHTRFRVIRFQQLELLTPNRMANLFQALAKYLRIAVVVFVLFVCLTLLFSLSPVTEGIVRSLFEQIRGLMEVTWQNIIALTPNLLMLLAIAVTTYYSLKALNFFYDGFRSGKVKFTSIHSELVEPTYQLLRFMVIAFALVAAFPYIPGSDSPVFRGLSIFVGFLLSLGSTSLVTNIISGIVLTYTRGLRIGDRVQIGDTTGDVIDRTLLATRIRTIKNVDVIIPNGMVMQNQIVNYSAAAAEKGLILNSTITIGYDAPWREVQQLLIDAALATRYILPNPRPFVLQTSLDDYYVSYQLNAYTVEPNKMATIYSELHQNIQDQFNQANVEIMSPGYFALREGPVTIPAEYLTGDPVPVEPGRK